MGNITPQKYDYTLSGVLAQKFIGYLIEIFNQNDVENFLAITFLDYDGNKYGITIQDCNKELTPQEKIKNLEAEITELRKSNERKDKIIDELHQRAEERKHVSSSLLHQILALTHIEDQLGGLEEEREELNMQKDIVISDILKHYLPSNSNVEDFPPHLPNEEKDQ